MALVPSPRTARAVPAFALALFPCLAAADIPPPPRNEGCSVELLERSGLECLVPSFTPYPQLWVERGFDRRCDLYRPYGGRGSPPPGAVWCRAPLPTSRAAAAAAVAPAAPRGEGGPPPRPDALAALARGTGALGLLLGEATSTWAQGPNAVTSPLAVWTALATTSGAARGTTAAELRRGLALFEADAGEALAAARALAEDLRRRGVSFTESSAVFLDDGRKGSPGLLALVEAAGARLEPADLRRYPGDTVRRLDAWLTAETGGRLTQLVPPRSLYRNSRIVLASAAGLAAPPPAGFTARAPLAFFVGAPEVPFRRPALSWGQRASVRFKDVPTLAASGTFAVASLDQVFPISGADAGAVVVDVPLAGGLAITLVVPHTMFASPPALRMTFPALLARLRPRRLELAVPAFAVEAPPTSLGDRLAGVGAGTPLRDAFDARDGDLSGVAADGDRLVLGELFHRAYLDLGAGAAAGAAPSGAGEDARTDARGPVLRVDHPFLFAVRDVASGVWLLAGTVKDPAPGLAARTDDVILRTLGPLARVGDPTVSIGATRVDGPLPREVVREVVEESTDVASCYRQQLVLEPSLHGTVIVRWTIDGDGIARDVKVDRAGTTVASEDLRDCVAGRIAQWSFHGRGPATAEQAWTLRPPATTRRGEAGSTPVRFARRHGGQPGERCQRAGAQEGLGHGATPAALPPPRRAAELLITGSLDEQGVREVLDAHAAEIRRVFEQRLAQQRGLQGTVAVEWVVDTDGRAQEPHVDCNGTTLDDPFVFESMKARIRTWTFPRPRARATAIVNHRWTFVPLSLPGPR